MFRLRLRSPTGSHRNAMPNKTHCLLEIRRYFSIRNNSATVPIQKPAVIQRRSAKDRRSKIPARPERISTFELAIPFLLLVVGTGGKNLRPFAVVRANSEVRYLDAFGVLKLTLAPGSYQWEFIPQAGKSFQDSGAGTCH